MLTEINMKNVLDDHSYNTSRNIPRWQNANSDNMQNFFEQFDDGVLCGTATTVNFCWFSCSSCISNQITDYFFNKILKIGPAVFDDVRVGVLGFNVCIV